MSNSYLTSFIVLALAACGGQHGDRSISAASLSEEYARSGREAQIKYNGREIAVTGYAAFPATMPLGDEEGSLLISDRERKLSHPGICRFSREQAAAFAQVRAGQYLTVRGVFSGEGGANLKFCSLAAVEDR